MADSTQEYDGPRVLLVEGVTDFHVVKHLRNAYKMPEETFGPYQCGNDEKVLARAGALIIGAVRPEVIGIMLDADKPEGNPSVGARWDSLKGKLEPHGYVFPDQPDASGTILPRVPGKPLVGIWLMPDNREPGMLEDFLLGMAPQAGVETAEKCIAIAKDEGVTSFKDVQYSKARIHTYLAWQDEPGRPLGLSITCRVLQPGTESARAFADWLARLFGVPAAL
jgi:hypothetical protein